MIGRRNRNGIRKSFLQYGILFGGFRFVIDPGNVLKQGIDDGLHAITISSFTAATLVSPAFAKAIPGSRLIPPTEDAADPPRAVEDCTSSSMQPLIHTTELFSFLKYFLNSLLPKKDVLSTSPQSDSN